LGTTHADSFFGNIPCTRSLSKNEVESDYETNTGKVILETFQKNRIDPAKIPGVVVRNHGPFTWGRNPNEAVYNAVVLERISEMDLKTLFLNKSASIPSYIIKKHYERKHGSMAYYGQKDGESS
jgi:L-ribulose-5-phosphate 4-epimerase